MPKVPERKLSYGEILENLHKAESFRKRRKEQKKALAPKKHRLRKEVLRHEYSYGEVMKHIDDIRKESLS